MPPPLVDFPASVPQVSARRPLRRVSDRVPRARFISRRQKVPLQDPTSDSPPRPVEKAVILAAGFGDRLRPFTDDHPKCLVPVGGVRILNNTLRHLAAIGIKEVVIVVGHHRAEIEKFGATHLGMNMTYVVSEDFTTTNNIYSLWLARAHLTEVMLLLVADVFFERAVLDRLVTYGSGNLAVVSQHQSWMSGMVVSIDTNDRIQGLFDAAHQGRDFDYAKVFKTANLYLFRGEFLRRYFLPQLEAYIVSGDVNEYYESILQALGHRGKNNLRAVVCDDLKWYEIDDESDRLAAEYLFASQEERYEHICHQHGGYWRFGFVDHAYLYNPYYPPAPVFTHFEQHLRELVLEYPSGQDVMARLIGTLIDQPPSRLVVGNGASELIKIIAGHVAGSLICPVPTFNEYENAARAGEFVAFQLPAPSFELDVDALAEKAKSSGARVAVVVTPNNPTSMAVPRADLLRLAEQLQKFDCMLVVDESFIDFVADPEQASLAGHLGEFQNLAIIKSLSKAFGIGGLRLGYLLTANEAFGESVRKELHIWNVNSFAESFLRLAPRYRRQFKESCARVANDRDKLHDGLAAIEGMTVFRAEANFVMCRLPDSAPSAPEVTKRLFVRHNSYVKHCAGKSMPDADRYLRIASRTTPENIELVTALQQCLET